MLLEVIVQTLPDALAAAAGGADRLEVVRDICAGGLTPSAQLVRRIQDATALPLRVMIREREGFLLESRDGDALREAVAEFASAQVDGLVIGFLQDGEPDTAALASVLAPGSSLSATFHRAFDAANHPLSAIDRLLAVPQVDRILTSAGEGDAAFVRCERLHSYSQRAGDRITIIAGGGIDEHVLGVIAKTGCVREVHVGRAARDGNDPSAPVSATRVQRLRELAM
jgi:copper homeostasis protein